MITQTINLNLIPGAVPPRVNVTQYDEGSRTIVANLYNGTSTFTPSAGTTAKVKGTKPDKHGFEYDATISGRTVEIDLTQQMSCVAGDVLCEVELTLNDEVLGTGTFVLRVKSSALADDTDISETELPDIIDAARSSAASAAASAEAAQEAANSVSVEYTVTGNPISVSAFPTEATTSMTIAPTQNLHGYDKPWAGGADVNKLKITANTTTIHGITFTIIKNEVNEVIAVDVDGTADSAAYINLSGTFSLKAGSYKFYIFSELPNGSWYADIPDGATHRVNTEGGTVAYSEDISNAAVWFNIVEGTTVNHKKIYPMLVDANETVSSFRPYSNVCPITGITTATVQTTDGETTNTASIQIGQTVYGGTINFNTGVLTITTVTQTLDSNLTWRKGANPATPTGRTVYYFTEGLTGCAPAGSDGNINNVYMMSNMYDIQNTSYVTIALADNFCLGIGGGSNSATIGVNTDISDGADFKTWIDNNPIQLVYPLATPTTLTLTPDTLTMLDGDQTVSGNGETVTISYDGNVKQYIDTKVPDAPTTDGTYTLTCVVSGGVPTYSWT